VHTDVTQQLTGARLQTRTRFAFCYFSSAIWRFCCLTRSQADRPTIFLTHRSHACRSGPGGNRSHIARRSVMRAARRLAFSSTPPASYSLPADSLLNFGCDRGETRGAVTNSRSRSPLTIVGRQVENDCQSSIFQEAAPSRCRIRTPSRSDGTKLAAFTATVVLRCVFRYV